eukprot:jgi/Picre1/28273/NNA_003679.t1
MTAHPYSGVANEFDIMSAHGQKSQANVPITATGCLERDGKLLGSLHPQAPFSGGIESVVEALLPYHALAKDVVLDSDYEYSTALTGEREKYQRRSDNLHESKGHASCVEFWGVDTMCGKLELQRGYRG